MSIINNIFSFNEELYICGKSLRLSLSTSLTPADIYYFFLFLADIFSHLLSQILLNILFSIGVIYQIELE